MCFIILRYDCFTLQIQMFLLQTYLLVILSSFHGGDLCDSFEVVAVTLISHFSLFFFLHIFKTTRGEDFRWVVLSPCPIYLGLRNTIELVCQY